MEDTEDRYAAFIQWFTENGGKSRDISFPTTFPPTNYIGLSAQTYIQRNTIIMAIPKHLIIGIERVIHSQIGFLIQQYPIFQGQDNDDKDFNILTLFIIFQQMKGNQSFYYPYLACIDISQTLIHWSDEEILSIKDPFLNIDFINEIRAEFQPTYHVFQQIVSKNQHLFKQQLTREMFDQCYGIVMTRCFGWGLPETMLVPFADFLNHHSNGVHHYIFSATLEQSQNKEYIQKRKQLNLQIFGIDNRKTLPVSYEKDSRQLYLEENTKYLQKYGSYLSTDVRMIRQSQFDQQFYKLREEKVQQNYNSNIYPSSDEQDNDTNSDSDEDIEDSKWHIEALRYLRQRKYFKKLFDFIDNKKQQPFNDPKPEINREFEDGVTFKWWYEQNDPYFIISTSQQMDPGSQIYNSYGRRNNRFLLLWYGFTFPNNKYDSVPFRMWNQKIEQQTGQLLFTRFITDADWKHQIPIGNERYPLTYLSPEFRLKFPEINYHFIAYLRFQIIRNDQIFSEHKNRMSQLHRIFDLQLQLKVIQLYLLVLKDLIKKYSLDERRSFKCMKQNYRQHFATILIESNTAIVQAHLRGTTNLLYVLNKLINRKQNEPTSLLALYHQQWNKEEDCDRIKIDNRLFVRYYFQMLQNYIKE